MTAQEIYEREGFLVLQSPRNLELFAPVTAFQDSVGQSRGFPESCVVIPIEEISTVEAKKILRRYNLPQVPQWYCYKVIAE
jgi:hypothetical protein